MRLIGSALFTVFAACAFGQDGVAPKPEAKDSDANSAQLEKGPGGPRSDLSSGPLLKLSSLPSRYQFLLNEAMRRFQLRDFKGALDYVDRADEILPPTSWSLNVRGAVAIEQRDFDRGFRYCTDALKVDPDFLPAKFNLCEIPFLRGKFADARRLWGQLFSLLKPGDSMSELLIYRIYLTFLLEKDFDHAKEWLDKLPFPSQTPAYQYAHAAWARQEGDLAKWNEWLRSAAFIWPESKRGQFVDVLIQLGWMKQE
jgi:tetratricopeptide (TPR) repeat protein